MILEANTRSGHPLSVIDRRNHTALFLLRCEALREHVVLIWDELVIWHIARKGIRLARLQARPGHIVLRKVNRVNEWDRIGSCLHTEVLLGTEIDHSAC